MDPELEYRVILHGPMKWKVSESSKNVVCDNTPYLVIYEPMAGILQLSQGTLTINSFKMYGNNGDSCQILSIWLFASLDDAELSVNVLSKMLKSNTTIIALCKNTNVTSILGRALTSFHLILEFVVKNIKRSLLEKSQTPKENKFDPVLESYRRCGIMGSFSLRVGLFDSVLNVTEHTDLNEHLYKGMEHKGAGINRLSFSFYEVTHSRSQVCSSVISTCDTFVKNSRNISDPINVDFFNSNFNTNNRSISSCSNNPNNYVKTPTFNENQDCNDGSDVKRVNLDNEYDSKLIGQSLSSSSGADNDCNSASMKVLGCNSMDDSSILMVNRCLSGKYPPIINDTSAGDKVLGVIDLDNSPTNDNFYYGGDVCNSSNGSTINFYPSSNCSGESVDNMGLSIDNNEWVDKRLYNDLMEKYKVLFKEKSGIQDSYRVKLDELTAELNEFKDKYALELQLVKDNCDLEVQHTKELYKIEILSLKSQTEDIAKKYELETKKAGELREEMRRLTEDKVRIEHEYKRSKEGLKKMFDLELSKLRKINSSLEDDNKDLFNRVKFLQTRLAQKYTDTIADLIDQEEVNRRGRMQDKANLVDGPSERQRIVHDTFLDEPDTKKLNEMLLGRLFISMVAQIKLKRENALLRVRCVMMENRRKSTDVNPFINTIMKCRGKIAKRTCQLHRIVELLGLSGPTTITGITNRIQQLTLHEPKRVNEDDELKALKDQLGHVLKGQKVIMKKYTQLAVLDGTQDLLLHQEILIKELEDIHKSLRYAPKCNDKNIFNISNLSSKR